MAERLDDLLTVHDLLDMALDHAELGLLRNEEARGVGAEQLGHKGHKGDAGDDDQAHPHAVVQHDKEHRDDDDDRHEQVGQRLADHLTQRVDVVGVVAHDIAALVRVEVADRQGLLVGEHVVADLLQRALLHGDDDPLPQPTAENAGRIQARHERQRAQQRHPIRIGGADHGQNVRVDQRLQEQRRSGLRRGTDENAHHHERHTPLVLEDVAEDTLGGAGCGFLHRRFAMRLLHLILRLPPLRLLCLVASRVVVFLGFQCGSLFSHFCPPFTAVPQAGPDSWFAIHRWSDIRRRFPAVRHACRPP